MGTNLIELFSAVQQAFLEDLRPSPKGVIFTVLIFLLFRATRTFTIVWQSRYAMLQLNVELCR
jgi:hypothetical protein